MPRSSPVRVYLAGPDVFLDSAIEQGERKKALCAARGLVGLFPFDNEIVAPEDGSRLDPLIYRANVAMMRDCDCAVFNLSAFRGPGVDDGTAFELGFLTALGKPCFGYVTDGLTLRQRIGQTSLVQWDEQASRFRDGDGYFVEDWGNAHNLMIDNAIAETGGTLVRILDAGGIADLRGFAACLDQVAHRYA